MFEEVLVDFSFVSDSDRAHAIAMFIQPFIRQMIDGPTPLFIVDSPTPGNGKGLLVQGLTFIATGRHIEMQAMPNQDAEMRKRITSKLMNFPSHFVFDNVRRKVDSAELSMAVTARVVVPQADVDLVRQRTRNVQVRLTERISEMVPALIKREVPAATDQLPSMALGSEGGGEIAIDPRDGQGVKAFQKIFQFDNIFPIFRIVPPVNSKSMPD